jgi:predicted transcriptional regulator of viral defense system
LCVPPARFDCPERPDWERLFQIAAGQEGHFTTGQAAEAGYSPQLITHHLRAGKIIRVRRGIYRLVHFPAGEHEELVAAWLWSEHQGVFSHNTALALHELSDVLPTRVHMTLPPAWRRRRFRVPTGVALHHADLTEFERSWVGVVPVTSPLRTLFDCAAEHLSPELLRQAVDQAVARGLVAKSDLVALDRQLLSFEDGTA